MSGAFAFNGHDLSRLLRANAVKSLSPVPEDSTETVPGRDGAVFVSSRLRPLEIQVAVRMRSSWTRPSEMSAIRRRLAGILITDGPEMLVLPDEPDKYYMAKLTDPGTLDTLWHTGGCTLTFTAYDPIAFGALSSVRIEGRRRVTVTGTYPASPVFRLRASGRVRVDNVTTGEFVELARDVADAAVIIDAAAQAATADGEPVPVTLASDYFRLRPGLIELSVSGAAGTVEWRERWK